MVTCTPFRSLQLTDPQRVPAANGMHSMHSDSRGRLRSCGAIFEPSSAMDRATCGRGAVAGLARNMCKPNGGQVAEQPAPLCLRAFYAVVPLVRCRSSAWPLRWIEFSGGGDRLCGTAVHFPEPRRTRLDSGCSMQMHSQVRVTVVASPSATHWPGKDSAWRVLGTSWRVRIALSLRHD